MKTRFSEALIQRCFRKRFLKMCNKDHPCRRVISLKLESNFIEITLLHEFSPVNLLHICCKDFLTNVIILLIFKIQKYSKRA